ncbi:EF hand family protein [Tritrichomonas foetus]|uniref:EF hand family protein n=1 Tax=Tritrichomonas foetus TaxID=1144522 RepID=A0A1J4J5U7_9EUKA|nr:EF hand family protein [Tritrichomonas foetus]|eukprot:OHS94602.1 EF hand family protein [Tritrichomonas foetus]
MTTKPATVRSHNFTLTDAEKQELRQAFNLFDKDGGGTIDADEVRVALRVLGFNPTLEELRAMIAKIDTQETGKVDFNEFTQILLKKISEAQPTDALVRSFNNLDIDMDGYITLEDLTTVADTLGEDLSQDELKEIIMSVRGCASQFDIHTKDAGRITQNEFINAINKSLDA